MNYPDRRNYHGLNTHAKWTRDVLKWRKENKERIAMLRYVEPLEAVDFGRN